MVSDEYTELFEQDPNRTVFPRTVGSKFRSKRLPQTFHKYEPDHFSEIAKQKAKKQLQEHAQHEALLYNQMKDVSKKTTILIDYFAPSVKLDDTKYLRAGLKTYATGVDLIQQQESAELAVIEDKLFELQTKMAQAYAEYNSIKIGLTFGGFKNYFISARTPQFLPAQLDGDDAPKYAASHYNKMNTVDWVFSEFLNSYEVNSNAI